MSNATLMRPDDVDISADEIAAAAFLVRYDEPTRTGYRTTLKHWTTWCLEHGITPLTATRPYVEIWMREMLEQKGLKPATVNGKINAVRGFYKLAVIDHRIIDNPTDYLKRPVVPRESNRQGLTTGELLRCLEVAKKSSPLDHALWCFLAYNGLRIGEACRIDVDHLAWEKGYRTVLVQRAKGNRSGALPLAPRTSHAFDTYLGSRTTGPLFLKPRIEERLDQKSANRIVHRVAAKTGITKKITPHSLRHTHITLALNAGVSVRDLTNSMGYADSRPVSTYDRDKDSLARHSTHLVSAFVEGS